MFSFRVEVSIHLSHLQECDNCLSSSGLTSALQTTDLHPAFFLLANLAAGTIPVEIGKLTALQTLNLFGSYSNPLKLSGKVEPQRFPFHDHMPRRVIGETQLLLA